MTFPDGQLETLARAHFTTPPLSRAEVKLVRNAPIGMIADCSRKAVAGGAKIDSAKNDESTSECRLRAALIRWICVDPKASALVDPAGIQVWNAELEGSLDLSFAKVPFPLAIVRCNVTDVIVLRQSEIPDLILSGSSVPMIEASGMKVR
jgi:hypothetical protein